MKTFCGMQSSLKIKSASDLYETADKNGITVDAFQMRRNKSLCIEDENGCHIALSPDLKGAEETEALAHELGHCMFGGFYNRYSEFDIIERAERRADKWAFLQLLPLSWVREQMHHGLYYYWEFAEESGLSEDFCRRALSYYLQAGLI